MAFDGQRRRLRHRRDHVQIVRRWGAWLAVIDGEGTECAAIRGLDRGRPARSQAVLESEIAELRPKRIGRDVLRVDGCAAACDRSAGADALADGNAVDRRVVGRREARGGAMAEMPPVVAQKQDRCPHLVPGLRLDREKQVFQHSRKWLPGSDLGQNSTLTLDQRSRRKSIPTIMNAEPISLSVRSDPLPPRRLGSVKAVALVGSELHQASNTMPDESRQGLRRDLRSVADAGFGGCR